MNTAFTNRFSWSVSRDRIFRECPRKYFFNYYGHWGGWEPDAPERIRRIYVLKQLKNRAIWAGEVVHDCIARSLKNLSRGIPVLPVEAILDITRNRMRQDFRNSRDGAYRQNPRSQCGLFEHEYGVNISDDQWKATADHVSYCIITFYKSEWYEHLSHMNPADFLEIEEFASFELDGTEVKIKLDCACRESDRIVIWDWKTGKTENVEDYLQMTCYAFYAIQTYKVIPALVFTRLFNLHLNKLIERSISQTSLNELVSYITGSIRDMQSMLTDPSINSARESDFSKVSKPDLCLRCNFLDVCKPDI
jgi:hypothetical protein